MLSFFCLAIEIPMYEIRGKAMYKTDGDCQFEIVNSIHKQLPHFMQDVICSENHGSSRYVCNVHTEKPKCIENKVKHNITLLILSY